jgi:MFS family permease
LRIRNYRLYFAGQGISLIGTWMQGLAQSWLVATLTKSPMMVGLVSAMQFLPVLVFAPYGGVLADRFRKRRVLLVTQSLAALLALALAGLTATGAIRVWMIFALAAGLGVVNALDNPTRQSFVHELVGPADLRNAVTLHSLEVNLMRIVGPALAGILIVAIGLPWCFFVNGVSFAAVIVCLVVMRPAELQLVPRLKPAKGQLREGLSYAVETPIVRDVLIMMTVVGMLTYEFQVTLTNLAKFAFDTNALGPATLTSAMGVGAVLGGLLTAGRRRSAIRSLTLASFAFGASMLIVAFSPGIAFAAVAMVLVGAFSLVFTSLTNTILQLETLPQMRGRVMALWSVAFLGTTAIGAPAVGWVAETFHPRAAILVGAVAVIFAGFVGLRAMRRDPHAASDQALVEQAEVAEKEDYR